MYVQLDLSYQAWFVLCQTIKGAVGKSTGANSVEKTGPEVFHLLTGKLKNAVPCVFMSPTEFAGDPHSKPL